MFEKVLVPLDGSPLAEAALPQLAAIFRNRDLEIVLFRAVDVPMMVDIASTEVLGTLEEQANLYLKTFTEKLDRMGPEVRWIVRYASPAEGIAEVAKKEDVSLIAMTTHGHSGIRRWTFGSVTEKVLRSGVDVPLLVLRSFQPALPIRRILVPVDGSEASNVVAPYAAEIAERLAAEVVLLHVREDHRPFPVGADPYARLAPATEAMERAHVRATGIVREGDPALRILEVAEQGGMGLIAMATHGRSGLQRWVLGSVAEKVLRAAHVPMLLVREPG